MESRLSEIDGSVDFDWEKIDGEFNPGRVAVEIVTGVISFLLAFVFSNTKKPQTAFRRFLALTYIIRPDLLENKATAELSKDLGVSKTELARHIISVRDELQISGTNLIHISRRLKIKAGQLKARESLLKAPIKKTKRKRAERLNQKKGARRAN